MIFSRGHSLLSASGALPAAALYYRNAVEKG
jgi:hypothetical protein